MSPNRREALGRNRKIERTDASAVYIVAFVAMVVAAFFTYRYFTVPERSYGWKHLDCSPFEIEWKPYRGNQTEITGCKRTAYVRCNEKKCVNANPDR